jgi:predicted Ser/Thr protein kinase
MNMDTLRFCPQCQQPLPANAPEGLCPQCLIKAAVSPPSEPQPVTTSGGDIPDIGDPVAVGKCLPQFEIIELLGRGGMGVVYKARQLNLDRIVALKILPPVDSQSADFVERFRREARSLAKLSHPNIVAVHDFGESGGLYYFAMEFVDGANLREMIRTGKMRPEEALAVVPKICDALQFAHEEGVVHRDVKPENILIDKRGRVKIADFGLAKLLRREQADHTLTMTGMTLGTPRYMAPEQLDKPETVDHRADIYSLGVVFYEMLTGEVPMGRFAPPSEKVSIDVRLDEIVLHALERDADRRYQHVSQVRDDVEKVTTSKPEVAPPSSAPQSAPVPKADAPAQSATRKPWAAWIWWTVLVLITLPFFQIAELNRAEQLAGHGPKYGMFGILPLLLMALGAFAVIKLLELRLTKAGATTDTPFSQAWLGIIAAVFGACLIAIGPFPNVEWLHETLKVIPSKVTNAAGATVELAGMSQTLVRHGYEYSEGKGIALVSVLAGALLLLAPRRLRWNVASSFLLMIAGVAITFFAVKFEISAMLQRNGDSYISALSLDALAKTEPGYQQFCDDFNRHKTTEAKDKNVPVQTIEHLSGLYNGAFRESKTAYGALVCFIAALALMMIGVLKLRQTMRSAPAAFAGWSRLVEGWSSLLLLVPCLITVLPAFGLYWVQDYAYIPLLNGEPWMGDWVEPSRLHLAGVDFWQGKLIAAAVIVALLVVIATALRRWKRGARAATLSLAGCVSIACVIHFGSGAFHEQATVSWSDFQAVAKHGAAAAESAETRKFLAEHPLHVGQLVQLEKNVQALAAKLAVPDPRESPHDIKRSADGTILSYTAPMPFLAETRKTQAEKLAKGGGVVSLYQNASSILQWPVLCGLGLLLLGIRDGWRAWRNRAKQQTPSATV